MNDGLLFDDEDDDVVSGPPQYGLVVMEPFTDPADLNSFEEEYRFSKNAPIMFIAIEEDGSETFENAAEFHRVMNLPAEARLPTIAEVEARFGSYR
jgi:hypothetical protein